MPTLLVAEDDADLRESLVEILRDAGHAVTAAPDGQAALDALAGGAFDLLVSDVDMPRLTGLQLAVRLRADARYRDLPIVFVTAYAEQVRDVPRSTVLSKPFSIKALFAEIDRALGETPEAAR